VSDYRVALLTAGRDHPYAFGMACTLVNKGISVDIIGADDLESELWKGNPHVRFLNMRGDLSETASPPQKVWRVLTYYVRLMVYAGGTKAKIFHILWNNKFEWFDRVPLMLYYKLLGKKTLLTVHNVNKGKRDEDDSWINRMTLRAQYQLVDHLFVHTSRMKQELNEQFDVDTGKISVIPFGINNAIPRTDLSSAEARRKLRITLEERVILFYGNIAPYKGLEYLIDAFCLIAPKDDRYRLIIAGNPKDCAEYWGGLQFILETHPYHDRILQKIEWVSDDETEVYFMAADVLVLPYRHIFQSGVLSLGYSFGLPVIASDVGSLRDDIAEGETGFLCRPEDSEDLANTIDKYFSSALYHNPEKHRREIREHAHHRYSWDLVGEITAGVYERLAIGGLVAETERRAV
jgi:D-inositol-3-phosphate glycosyltransferase